MSVTGVAPLRLRPLEIGDLLDETFRMYRRHFVLFAGISVVLSIPSAALSGLAFGLLGSLVQVGGTGAQPDFSALGLMLPVLALASLLGIALVPFSYGAVMYAACESAMGRPVSAGGIVRGVGRRYFALLGYWLLFFVSLFVSLLLCVLPVALWTWLFVMWIVATPAMFVENISLGAATGRSRMLVQGRWWRTFLVLFLLVIVFYVVRLALSAFVEIGQLLLDLVLSPFVAAAIASASAQIIDALVSPMMQIALVLVYFDLRVRREALDLFQMAHRLAMPSVETMH
ncbi:MAG TPA: hypothetical protein VEU76_07345 [Candidatus Udaeobacter sp.]|nr:hypothetical protein [Candidatus Udaeobacter sp.]